MTLVGKLKTYEEKSGHVGKHRLIFTFGTFEISIDKNEFVFGFLFTQNTEKHNHIKS